MAAGGGHGLAIYGSLMIAVGLVVCVVGAFAGASQSPGTGDAE